MERNEAIAFHETPLLGCWYCGSKICCLTHKKDDIRLAFDKSRDPYKSSRPKQVIIVNNPDYSKHLALS